MARSPDRALRREVARLAIRDPHEIEAILAELDPAQRLRVQNLLRDYLRGASPQAFGGSDELRIVSDWLANRVSGDAGTMTAHARQFLGECIDRLRPPIEPAFETVRPRLVEQGLAALARTRRAR